MRELLSHPAVQAGAAPFVAGLLVALALRPLRLSGLAASAALMTTAYLVSGMQLGPLTATRKLLVLALAAPAAGILVDFAFKPTRLGGVLLALAAGAGALWAFAPDLARRSAAEAWLAGASAAIAAAFAVGFAQTALATDGVRAGAAALALGVGAGVASIVSGSAEYGRYGLALAAGAGAFLLPQVVSGVKSFAGATFTLPAMLAGVLVAAGAMTLGRLPWYAVLVLGLVPLAARLPAPERAPLWLQALVASLYGLAVAALACFLAFRP